MLASVARMSEATCGVKIEIGPDIAALIRATCYVHGSEGPDTRPTQRPMTMAQ